MLVFCLFQVCKSRSGPAPARLWLALDRGRPVSVLFVQPRTTPRDTTSQTDRVILRHGRVQLMFRTKATYVTNVQLTLQLKSRAYATSFPSWMYASYVTDVRNLCHRRPVAKSLESLQVVLKDYASVSLANAMRLWIQAVGTLSLYVLWFCLHSLLPQAYLI